MNSDALATICTMILLATKIVLLPSRGGPIEGVLYFIYCIWTLIFWGNMRVIVDAITGKEYIRGSSRTGGVFKISRNESPIRYYLKLLLSLAFSAFSAAVIFDIYKFY